MQEVRSTAGDIAKARKGLPSTKKIIGGRPVDPKLQLQLMQLKRARGLA